MKDAERFLSDLELPADGNVRGAVTDRDIEQDGANFMAFASMMGVRPPKPAADTPVALPSA